MEKGADIDEIGLKDFGNDGVTEEGEAHCTRQSRWNAKTLSDISLTRGPMLICWISKVGHR